MLAKKTNKWMIVTLAVFGVLLILCGFKTSAEAFSVMPYTPDANTVLLDHFDGATSASILAYREDGVVCGPYGGFPKPSATPSLAYGPGPNGLSQALSLNPPVGEPAGSGTYLKYPGGQLLSQPNGTIEFWTYLTTYGPGVGLVQQGPFPGSCAGWTFSMGVSATGQLQAGAWAAFNMNSGAATVPLNAWTHVAASWGSTGAKLYMNGALVGSDSNTGMPAAGYAGSVLLNYGARGVGTQIDELRISNVQRTSFESAPPSTLSFSGWVKSSPNWPSTEGLQPVIGATVSAYLPGTPPTLINTAPPDSTTGAFTLTGIPSSTTFYLLVQPPQGYLPVLSKLINWDDNIQALLPFVLFTPTQYSTTLGNTQGNGIILGRVARQDSPTTFLPGATVTAQEWIPPVDPATQPTLGEVYTVTYTSGSTTQADGIYMVKNVPAGKLVQLVVTLTGHTFEFNGAVIPVQAGFISEESFFGTPSPTISFSGYVMDNVATPNPIGGATIERAGAIPPNATTSNQDGSYILTGLPKETPFHLKFTKVEFTPTYTANMSSMTDIEHTQAQAFKLFPANQLSTWGIDAGKGVIRARIRDQAMNYVGGAVVTVQSQFGQAYKVCYDDACTPALTATEATSGRYIVRNVLSGDLVTVTATKAGWTFNSRIYRTHADSISQGGITGQSLTADEQAIGVGLAAAVAAINAGNLTGFMAYVSDNYLDDGENKAAFQANVQELITADGKLSYTLGTITIQGDIATVSVTWTFMIGGQSEVDQETLIFRNESGTWRIYGNQQRHEVRVSSQHWASGYNASFSVDDPGRQITGVTVTGPGITGSLSLTPHDQVWDGQPVVVWWYDGGGPSIDPSTTPTYTITVTDGTVNTVYNRQITGWVQAFATNLSPAGQAGGPVIFTWTGPSGTAKYAVELNDATGFNRIWNTYGNNGDDIPPTRPWAVYNGPALEAGKTYRYWVVARDANDNSSFAEGQFTYNGPAGISFTGQVTAAADGAALPGVAVTLAWNPNPDPSATSNVSGNFTLPGVPQGSHFTVKMEKVGYLPTYTHILRSQNPIVSGAPYGLFTPTDTASWPVNFTTKGAIASRVVDAAGNYITGAVVRAQSLLHPDVSYAVTYRDDAGNFGGSSTHTNGRFYIMGVDEGDIVTVTVVKSGYTFQERKFHTRSGGISQGRITGTPQAGTITFSAKVTDATGQTVSGVTVQVVGNPAIGTLTNPDGSFTLAGIPANTPFVLMFSKAGFVTAYSAVLQSGSPLTSPRPFVLFTQTNLTAWGIAAGKGAIMGVVVESAYPTTGSVAGARVSATGAAMSYAVVYLNDDLSIASGASSTQANGRYLVPNVDDGDTVSVTASKDDWMFQPRTFRAFANALSIGIIYGMYNPLLKGDVDGNRVANLADAILALQVVSGMQPAGIRTDYATSGADVNGDRKIGAAEAIHVIQVLSGLRVDPFSQLQQEAVNGVNASLALFRDTWNANQMNYDYLPFFHTNYLNDGLNRVQAALSDMPPAGFQITSYAVNSVVSFDAAQKIITVEISYTGTESGIDTETFAYDASSGQWLRYGNQRIGEFSVWLGKSRTMPVGGGTMDKFIAHFHLKAVTNTVTQVVVTGPAGWTQTFANRQPWFDDPDNFDGFYTTSGGMDVDITRTPQAGDVYTFTVHKNEGGTVTYTQTVQHVLNEAPTIASLNGVSPPSHSFTGLAGNKLNIVWSLPDPGIGMDNIRIESNFMSLAGSVEGVVTSPTGGYIDIPAGATGGYIDVRIHHQGEIFTNCRFEFGP